MPNPSIRLRPALLCLAFALLAELCSLSPLGAGSARAQYMSCSSFMALEPNLRHLYLTGFVEGLTYTQLELVQLVNQQSEQKDLQDQQKLALAVMSRVADNIAEGVPSGLTVEQVADKLVELCKPGENAKTAFLNIYSQYSLGLRQALRLRMEQEQQKQAQQAGSAAPAEPPAKKKPAAKAAPAVGGAAGAAPPAPAAAPKSETAPKPEPAGAAQP